MPQLTEEDKISSALRKISLQQDDDESEGYSAVTGSRALSAPRGLQVDSSEEMPEPSESSTTSDLIGFDPRVTDLNYFHGEAAFLEQISSGEFTKVRCVADCCPSQFRGWHGKVELHRWRKAPKEAEQAVVVKRVQTARVRANLGKQCNEHALYCGCSGRYPEDCLTEIGVYCYLSRQQDLPQYILSMLMVFESSSDTWLVLEHASDGDLFSRVQAAQKDGSPLSASLLMTWTWQLLQGVTYLHKHCIGHRDISLENVLLCDSTVRLMDFGQSVRTHSPEGVPLRYFLALGKPCYRPPECYSPSQTTVQMLVPQGAQPGEAVFDHAHMIEALLPPTAVPGQVCTAEHWGYTVPPVDVFACGVCLFIMSVRGPPWKQAHLSDSLFAWVQQQRHGVAELAKQWNNPLPAEADKLLAAMVQPDPSKRPSAQECLSHIWFHPMGSVVMPVHRQSCAEGIDTFASAGSDTPLGDVADVCRPSSSSAQQNFAHTRSAPPTQAPSAQRRPCATGKMPRRRSVPASRDRRSAGRETTGRVSSSSEESAPAGSGLNAVRRAKSLFKSRTSMSFEGHLTTT